MKFAFAVVAVTSSVSTPAVGSRIGTSIFKENPFALAEALEPHCSAVIHNATSCFEDKDTGSFKDFYYCFQEADTEVPENPCGGFKTCVEKYSQNSQCVEYEKKVDNCCSSPPPAMCQMEEEAAKQACMQEDKKTMDSCLKLCYENEHIGTGDHCTDKQHHICTCSGRCATTGMCGSALVELNFCQLALDPEGCTDLQCPHPNPDQPSVCKKEQEATDCIVWHAPGAMRCLQDEPGPETSLCERIRNCKSYMGHCESKVNIAANECWGCPPSEKPPADDETHQVLNNVARVMKKSIRG